MPYKEIPLQKLTINRANDRHGELENETAAIAWLFNEREAHMRNLAADIVDKGEIYEPPLVCPDGMSFVVFDGNRRITCLKLLENPRRAPTVPLREYFEKLRVQWKGTIPSDVTSQIETDRDRIDDILFRRHTGAQSGVGQSNWDDRMKLNFIDRTGLGGAVNIAAEIEKILEAHDMMPKNGRLPRSNFNRLLSAEAFRSRVGFTIRNRKVEFTHEEPVVLAALSRIVCDLIDKEIVLGDIWDVDGKRAYLNRLESEGILPIAAHALKTPSKPPALPRTPFQPRPEPRAKPERRTTLIPNKVYSVSWPGKLQRHHAIWEELQFKLHLHEHPNAIAVLFRVLVELAIENYMTSVRLHTILRDDTLRHRFNKVAAHLYDRDKITGGYKKELARITSGTTMISFDTLNSYVHSRTFSPAPENICAMWDTMAEFVVLCLNE